MLAVERKRKTNARDACGWVLVVAKHAGWLEACLLGTLPNGCLCIAGPGSLTWAHFSPPCQALSLNNRHRSYRRVERELFPRLAEVTPGVQCSLSLVGGTGIEIVTADPNPKRPG
jgi:hypothetical protein